MNYSKLRKLNLLWALFSVIGLIICCVIIWLCFKQEKVILWDFIISGIGGFAIFWCIYLLRFCSRKTNYPFVLSESKDYTGIALRFIYDNEFIWVILFPIISALFMPGFYLLLGIKYTTSYADKENVKLWVRIIIIISITFIEVLNNIIYLQVVKNVSEEKATEFITRK
ncbi:hypothetical protein [Spiroplasma endosymbiont of Aspidapion aeneum]|uniref:hypothetical protein n=1 Tax=Spiroplasma endosymbiont of Aspidapion aeneum TaxID=3066276 RepID=UPI00313EE9F0